MSTTQLDIFTYTNPKPSSRQQDVPRPPGAPRLLAPPIEGMRRRSFLFSLLVNVLILWLLASIKYAVPAAPPVTVTTIELSPIAQTKPTKAIKPKPGGEGAARKAAITRPFVLPSPKARPVEPVEPPPVALPHIEVAERLPPPDFKPRLAVAPAVNLDPQQRTERFKPGLGTKPDGDPLFVGGNGTKRSGHGKTGTGPEPPDLGPQTPPQYLASPATPPGPPPPPKPVFSKAHIEFVPRVAYPYWALPDRIEGDVIVRVGRVGKPRPASHRGGSGPSWRRCLQRYPAGS